MCAVAEKDVAFRRGALHPEETERIVGILVHTLPLAQPSIETEHSVFDQHTRGEGGGGRMLKHGKTPCRIPNVARRLTPCCGCKFRPVGHVAVWTPRHLSPSSSYSSPRKALMVRAAGTAMTTPTIPNNIPPVRKQKMTRTGRRYAALPSTIGAKNWSIEIRSAIAYMMY